MRRNLAWIAFVFTALAALGLSATPLASAADAPARPTGTISGKVIDAAGKGVKDVQVQAFLIARGGNKGAWATAKTAKDGTYSLAGLPAGSTFFVYATLKGFDAVRSKGVLVVTNQDVAEKDITLKKTAENAKSTSRPAAEK